MITLHFLNRAKCKLLFSIIHLFWDMNNLNSTLYRLYILIVPLQKSVWIICMLMAKKWLV